MKCENTIILRTDPFTFTRYMRSELGKECRKLFRKVMATQFPEYREDKGQIIPTGKYVWTRQHPSGIWLYILFMIDPTRDTFTTEAAWDFDGKLPRFSHSGADGIFQRPVWFRVNFLWSGKDYWWPLVLCPEVFERAILYKDDPVERMLAVGCPGGLGCSGEAERAFGPCV